MNALVPWLSAVGIPGEALPAPRIRGERQWRS
jgi:hypothetical protein